MAIQPKGWKRAVPALLVVLTLVAGLAGCSHVPGVYTYVPESEATSSGGGGAAAFDAKAYAEKNWTEKVLPAVEQDAIDARRSCPLCRATRLQRASSTATRPAPAARSPS